MILLILYTDTVVSRVLNLNFFPVTTLYILIHTAITMGNRKSSESNGYEQVNTDDSEPLYISGLQFKHVTGNIWVYKASDKIQAVYKGETKPSLLNGNSCANGEGELISVRIYTKGIFKDNALIKGIFAIKDTYICIGDYKCNSLHGPNTLFRDNHIFIGEYYKNNRIRGKRYDMSGKLLDDCSYVYDVCKNKKHGECTEWTIGNSDVTVSTSLYYKDECVRLLHSEIISFDQYEKLSIAVDIPKVNYNPSDVYADIIAGALNDIETSMDVPLINMDTTIRHRNGIVRTNDVF